MRRVTVLLLAFCVPGVPLLAQMDTPSRIARVEKGLLPAVPVKGEPAWTIQQRMRQYGAVGVSVAVIDSFRVAWAKGYGVKNAATREPVTTGTLFQAASISKPVNATAVLREVQKGRLALDVDVNQYLRSWKLPENEMTAGSKVTLANLLSHTGGTTVSGFPGYAPDSPLPTIHQILNGQAPANTARIVVDIEPGRRFRYSGGGTTITQLLLTELEGKPYAQLMKELVLDPVGMTSSTFAQPLPDSLVRYSATAHGRDGSPLQDRVHVYPEMAAAGLWTTPTDLAKFAIEHQLSLLGKSNRILSAESEAGMMTPYIGEAYGLGFGIDRKGNAEYFQHSGGNYGFTCLLIAHKWKGYGAVVMLNSYASGLVSEIIRAVAREYGWEEYVPLPIEVVRLDPAHRRRVTGRYLLDRDEVVRVEEKGGKLIATVALERVELLPVSDTEFFTGDVGRRAVLMKGARRESDTLKIFGGQSFRLAPRLNDDQLAPNELLQASRTDEALHQYREIRRSDPSDPAIDEARLNQLAYQLLGDDKVNAAVALFAMNVEFYPTSWNVYDSLGEAFAKRGDKESAIKNYEKALRLNPDAESAKTALKELRKR